jgi:hypothetical protein
VGRSVSLAIVGALALLLAAGPAHAFNQQVMSVPPGYFNEVNLNLTAGQSVAWRVVVVPSSERAAFDIHTHDGPRVLYLQNQTVEGGELRGNFTAPSKNLYSWLVENDNSSKILHVTIETTVSGGDGGPIVPTPSPTWLAFAALAGALLLTRRAR